MRPELSTRQDSHPLRCFLPKRLASEATLVVFPNTTIQAGLITNVNFPHFIRYYFGNHINFLFLHLLICLNSVGSLGQVHALTGNSHFLATPSSLVAPYLYEIIVAANSLLFTDTARVATTTRLDASAANTNAPTHINTTFRRIRKNTLLRVSKP